VPLQGLLRWFDERPYRPLLRTASWEQFQPSTMTSQAFETALRR
jgi:hypothetical protein